MSRVRTEPLPAGTPVSVDIAQGLAVAEGAIAESRWDDGWMYRVDVTGGDDCRSDPEDRAHGAHRNPR